MRYHHWWQMTIISIQKCPKFPKSRTYETIWLFVTLFEFINNVIKFKATITIATIIIYVMPVSISYITWQLTTGNQMWIFFTFSNYSARLFSEIHCDVFDCMFLHHKLRPFFLFPYFYFQRVNIVIKWLLAAMSTQPYKLPANTQTSDLINLLLLFITANIRDATMCALKPSNMHFNEFRCAINVAFSRWLKPIICLDSRS